MDKIVIQVLSKKTRRWKHQEILNVPVGGDLSVTITADCNMLRYKVSRPLIVRKSIINNPIRFVDTITRMNVRVELIRHGEHPRDNKCLARDSLLIKSDADLLALEHKENNLIKAFKPYQQAIEIKLSKIWNCMWE